MTVKRKILLVLVVAAALGAVGAAAWYFTHDRTVGDHELMLYGNVDIRQVQLAFNGSERIATMQAREGDIGQERPVAGDDGYRPLGEQCRTAAGATGVAAATGRPSGGRQPSGGDQQGAGRCGSCAHRCRQCRANLSAAKRSGGQTFRRAATGGRCAGRSRCGAGQIPVLCRKR